MKVAILSREQKNYSTRRLRDALRSRKHDVRVFDTLHFSLLVEEQVPDLYYRNRRVETYDAIIPRIGASITNFGTAVVRQFEQMGVFSLNASQAITVSRDKLRSLQVLSRHDIGMPPSAFVRDRNDVLPAIRRVGGAPVVIKVLEGTQGVGVILAESEKIASAIIETLHSARQSVLIQKFVAESAGRDVRAFVVGDHVVAAMRRVAQGQEFRSNIHRGGMAEALELSEDYERTAVMAAQILGLQVAGVDMLESADGPQVMEVNSSPGLEGIEKTTGIDVAGAIVQRLEEQVMFPELDVKQRLRFAKGYAVAEIPVRPKSHLAKRTLQELELRNRDVQVLSITRNGVVIPNPSGEDQILPRDHLLCYGKMNILKDLVAAEQPKRRQRPTRKKKKKNAKGTSG